MPPDSLQVDGQHEHGERNPALTRGATPGDLATAAGTGEAKLTEPMLRQDEQELRRIVDLIPQTIVVLNPVGRAIYANRVTLEYTGLSLDEVRADNFRDRVFHPEDIQRLREARHTGLSGTVPFENEQRALGKDGKYRWFLVRYNPLLDERGNVLRWYATGTDIQDRKQTETLHAAEKRTLEMIASGACLPDILERLCETIDAQASNVKSAVMLLDADGMHLRHAAGHRVPKGWVETITPLKIGPCVGSCGSAAFLKQRVIVSDIARDPLWADYRELALSYGLRAAWSQPLVSKKQDVLGTFGMYYPEVRTPSETDLILTYSDLGKLIDKIKSLPKPLAGYVFSRSQQMIDRVLQSVSFGGGAVNQTNVTLFIQSMPYGGVGSSGVGNYYGKYGYDSLTHAKSILISPPDVAIDHLFPPYTEEKVQALSQWFEY